MLSEATVREILKEENPRVEKQAIDRIFVLIRKKIREISHYGRLAREHAGRSTLTREDIDLLEEMGLC
mgnify:CR=1 FL=1